MSAQWCRLIGSLNFVVAGMSAMGGSRYLLVTAVVMWTAVGLAVAQSQSDQDLSASVWQLMLGRKDVRLAGTAKYATTVIYDDAFKSSPEAYKVIKESYSGIDGTREFDISLSGQALRLESNNDATPGAFPFVYAFDGTTAKMLTPKQHVGLIQPNGAMRYTLFFRDPARLGQLVLPEYASENLEQLHTAVLASKVRQTSEPGVVELEYRDPWQPYLRSIQVDLSKGGLMMKCTTKMDDGTIDSEEIVEDVIKLNDGSWIAKRVREVNYYGGQGGNRLPVTVVSELKDVKEEQVPAKAFTLEFPPNTRVVDQIVGASYSLMPEQGVGDLIVNEEVGVGKNAASGNSAASDPDAVMSRGKPNTIAQASRGSIRGNRAMLMVVVAGAIIFAAFLINRRWRKARHRGQF